MIHCGPPRTSPFRLPIIRVEVGKKIFQGETGLSAGCRHDPATARDEDFFDRLGKHRTS